MKKPLILFTADRPFCKVSRLYLIIAAILFAVEGMSFADDVGKSDGTALGDLAAKMKPGEWAELKTKNADLLHYGKDASYNLMEYADTACWDPKSKQFLFFGGSHYKTSARFVAYSAKTNSWRVIPHPFETGQRWHAYDMNAIDPIRGEFYIGEHKYRIADGKWSTLPAHGQNFGRGHTAVEYFPELDGPLFIANGQVLLFERKSKQWRALASGLDQSESGLHPLAAYSPVDKVVLFGGWGGTKKMWKLDAEGKVKPIKSAPVRMDIWHAILTVDPVSGQFLVFANGRKFLVYDVKSDTWTERPSAATFPIFKRNYQETEVFGTVAALVSEYGVVMFAKYDLFGDARVFLYKHADKSSAPNESAIPRRRN